MRLLLTSQPHLHVVGRHPSVQLHMLARGRAWASRGYDLLQADLADPELTWRPAGRIPTSLLRRAASRSNLAGQALRLGVHGLLPLSSGALLASVSGRLLRSDDGRVWEPVLQYEGFRKPARQGLLADHNGRVWVAQYALNPARNIPIRLWRSDDDGRTFQVGHCFEPGRVRHIHFIQLDPHDGSLWMGTGDRDQESALYRSSDGGGTWTAVGQGSQQWRAIALAFREDAVIWGTDAGLDAAKYGNRIMRLDRQTGQVSEGPALQGPVHGITTTADGGVLMATGIEGGANETDARVHVWYSTDGQNWRQIAQFHRGLQPTRVQYAVCHFAPDQSVSARTFLVLRGVLAASLATIEVQIR